MAKVQSLVLNLKNDEIKIIEDSFSQIRGKGFFLSEVFIHKEQISISPYDLAEVLSRVKITLNNEMIFYRLKKQAVEKIDPNSFEYYLVAGVKIGGKSNESPRVRRPIPLFN